MLRSLERAIGRESANLEFKWMLENGGSIKEMLKRRLKGEPLQYILGMPYIYPRFGPTNKPVKKRNAAIWSITAFDP